MMAVKRKFYKHAGWIGVLGALMLLIPIINGVLDRKETIDDWFIVTALAVPDHSIETDPIIDFDRVILKTLSGRWSVETQRKTGDRWTTVCRGTGLSHYSTDEELPSGGVTLGWFRGKCEKRLGVHRMQVVWQFTEPETGETKTRIFETNEFTVTK